MLDVIQQYSLIGFEKLTPHLAKRIAKCGAHEFITGVMGKCATTDRHITQYEFKSLYLDPDTYSYQPFCPYCVLSIKGKAFLMYEREDDGRILIWACYTEPKYRNTGHATKLLSNLKRKHPNEKIVIDTYCDSLLRHCDKIGIDRL